MANCKGCPSEGSCSRQDSCSVENNPNNKVKHIIGVMSGKGGVGKSTISALIAAELKRRGLKVGLLDADITGPSIPRLFGIKDASAVIDKEGIHPVKGPGGIDVMSMNLLMEYEEQAVIWRGPLIAGAVKQFWTDVLWGELDFLIIDMPPGTGDVPLTVMQSIPIAGVVLVSTPQNLVSMIVAKAVSMAEKMNIKVIGVIENMSYVTCPDCSNKIELFGVNAAEEAAEKVGAKLLGELPMERELIEMADEGRVYEFVSKRDNFRLVVDGILEEIEKGQ